MPGCLAEIYDAEIEDAVRDAYPRDYVAFGFRRLAWPRARLSRIRRPDWQSAASVRMVCSVSGSWLARSLAQTPGSRSVRDTSASALR